MGRERERREGRMEDVGWEEPGGVGDARRRVGRRAIGGRVAEVQNAECRME